MPWGPHVRSWHETDNGDCNARCPLSGCKAENICSQREFRLLTRHGTLCIPDKRGWSAPITTMRAILKRYLVVRIDPRARSVRSTSFVEGNQTSCSLGIKLLLVRSPPQGIEQTSTRSRTNDPVVRRSG